VPGLGDLAWVQGPESMESWAPGRPGLVSPGLMRLSYLLSLASTSELEALRVEKKS